MQIQKNCKLLISLTIIIGLLAVRSGKFTSYINLIYFVIIFLFYKIKFSDFALIYLFYFSFLLLLGVLNSNDSNSILEDVFSFVPLILPILNENIRQDLIKNIHTYLANSLFFLLPICVLIFKYMDYGIGTISTTRFNYDDSTNFELFAPIIPILYSPYLLFFFNKFKKNQKIIVIISNIFIMFMGLITLSRSTTVIVLIPLILILLYKLFWIKFKPFKLSLVFTIILVISLAIQNTSYYKNSDLKLLIDGIEARNDLGKDNDDISSGRFDEANQYFNQRLSLIEIIFGKGLGGHKVRNINESYIGGINMLHIGVLHVFMKGGILLVLLMYFPLLIGIFIFWNTSNFHYSLLIIYFLIENIQTSNWSWGITIFIYWFLMSIIFQNFKILNKKQALLGC